MISCPKINQSGTVGREFLNGVDTIIRHQQRTVVGNVKAMGSVAKVFLSKRTLIVPLAFKNHNVMIAPSHYLHIILVIHSHALTLHIANTLRQFTPSIDIFVAKIANAINLTHGISPPVIADLAFDTEIVFPLY